jgi:hypothetical protein
MTPNLTQEEAVLAQSAAAINLITEGLNHPRMLDLFDFSFDFWTSELEEQRGKTWASFEAAIREGPKTPDHTLKNSYYQPGATKIADAIKTLSGIYHDDVIPYSLKMKIFMQLDCRKSALLRVDPAKKRTRRDLAEHALLERLLDLWTSGE